MEATTVENRHSHKLYSTFSTALWSGHKTRYVALGQDADLAFPDIGGVRLEKVTLQ